MTRKFHNKKSIWWLIGMGLLVTGFLTFALVMPNRSQPSVGPEVNVPNMQNVPPSHAPNMQLDIEEH